VTSQCQGCNQLMVTACTAYGLKGTQTGIVYTVRIASDYIIIDRHDSIRPSTYSMMDVSMIYIDLFSCNLVCRMPFPLLGTL
jgi:hypothetical protein